MPAACRAASAAHMRRGVERQPRLSSHPCHARRRAPCAPVGALAVLPQPARRGAMHPGHCVGRQPACLSTEQERMLRTLAQHQLASNQALSPLHSRPRAPAAALLNAQAQEPPLVVAALCSAACEQRSARQTRGTPGRLWDGGPPSECEPHRRPCLPQPRASGAKRQRRACFSVTVLPSYLEHLECGHQPHAQDRGAEKRTQLAGRSASGCGQESPSPGGARSQGHNTGLRGLAPRTRFPLNCRTLPLLGAKEYSPRVGSALWVAPSCGTPPLLGASGHGHDT